MNLRAYEGSTLIGSVCHGKYYISIYRYRSSKVAVGFAACAAEREREREMHLAFSITFTLQPIVWLSVSGSGR